VSQTIIQNESGNAVPVDPLNGSIPDVLMPSQFFELVGARNWSSEQRLMLAVVADAVNLIGQHRTSKHRQRDEALSWVFVKGLEGPMSFERVCDALGVNADDLRRRLSALRSPSSGTFQKIRVKEAGRIQRVTANRRRIRIHPRNQARAAKRTTV
jgi:hypothetical protein